MLSLQGQTTSQPPIDHIQAPLVWKNWEFENSEFERYRPTKINYGSDKILILGGYLPDGFERTLNLVLMDPETQTFKIIESTGDVESSSWGDMSACYWKGSTVVVFGGYDYAEDIYRSTVAVVTLKGLDSENPSAHWKKMVTPTELVLSAHTARIYQDKMYVFEGEEDNRKKYDVWCLDLAEFTWSQCDFKDYFPQTKEYEKGFVFHENKVYAIQKGILADVETIHEFDLETLCYKQHIIPKSQTDRALIFDPFPQVIDGKIYFIEDYSQRPKDVRQVLAFDLGSQSWTEIVTESFPNINKTGRTLCCNNQLIFDTILQSRIEIYGEFWSLSLNLPKPSKYSATSATVSKVQQTMKEFFFEAPYSDVSFEVESQIIPAHKWVLVQKSRFFATLFSSEMLDEKPTKININDLKADTFRAFLEYLYSDHVEIDDTIALELLQQATKYFIAGELKTACEKHILKNIEPENYVAFGKLAESIDATSLRDAVVLFIARNMKNIKTRKDFHEISDALLRDSIVKFIVK